MRRLAATLLLALATPASAAAAAAPPTLEQVLAQYQALHAIPPCRYSLADLRRVRHEAKGKPQATLAFRHALRREITRQKQGACSGGAAQGATTTPAPATTTPAATTPAATAPAATTPPGATTPAAPQPQPTPGPQATPGPAPASHDKGADGTTALLLGIAVLAAVIALGLLAWAIARWGAWEPAWALGARHALGEAGYRVSATWAEFADWLRLGR